MVIDILLVLWFSVSPDTMLLLYATLRDILIVRMGMFSSSVILSILSDTLIHYLLQWGEGIRRSQTIADAATLRASAYTLYCVAIVLTIYGLNSPPCIPIAFHRVPSINVYGVLYHASTMLPR